MIYTSTQKNQGFTLIELMVVITIIGLLASVVLASLTTARAKARDAARMQMVKEIQKALELYRNANGGNYPCADGPICQANALPSTSGNSGAQVSVNGSTRTFTPPNNFDTVVGQYLTLQNESIAFAAGPNPNLTRSQGSIWYRLGPNGAARIKDSYAILLRRELATTNAAGLTIPAGTFCVIRSGLNSNVTNIVPTTPDCF